MTEKIIIDTDPGIDDAMAIFFAFQAPEIEVLGLTTIFGNVHVDMATRNALTLCEIAGKNIPVAKGMAMPWVGKESEYAHFVHGDNGFGNVDIPLSNREADPRPAAQFIIDTAKQYPGEVTLVAVGPLGNLALALRLEPELPKLLKRVVIMGGAALVPGNVSPVAEANIWNDPYAAAIVFNAGWPLTMIGLDVTYAVDYDQSYLSGLKEVNPKLGGIIEEISQFYVKFYSETYQLSDKPICYFHDAMAIAQVVDPSLFEYTDGHIKVSTDPLCYGQTSFAAASDPNKNELWSQEPVVSVAMKVDESRIRKMFMDYYAK